MKKMISASLAVTIALLAAGVARANDTVHVGKAQGTAWTFLPVDVGVEQGSLAGLALGFFHERR